MLQPSKEAKVAHDAADKAAILARLESHARAFFGSSSEDEQEQGGGKVRPPQASQKAKAVHAVAFEPAGGSDASSSDSDRSSGDDSTSSDGGEGEAGGGRTVAGAPDATTTRRAVVIVAGPGGGGSKKGPPGAAPTTHPPADLKAERKALMSGRADVTGGGPLPAWKKGQQPRPPKKGRREAAAAAAAGGAAAAAPADPTAIPTKAEFAAIRREVEEFGVANLDKRGRAAAEARRLSSLGFPAAKGPRIPASIGYGRAAKQKELAAAALEAAIDAGLISRSGLGKKKRRAAEAARRAAGDGGAGSLDGSGPLRNGVLFVKEAPAKKRKGPGGGRRFNIDKIKL